MQQTYRRIFLYTALILAISACTSKKSVKQNITQNWKFTNFQANSADPLISSEKWQFSGDGTLLLIGKQKTRKGIWELLGDTSLKIELSSADTSITVDSTAVSVSNGSTITSQYYKGNKVAEINNGVTKLLSESYVFKIKNINGDQLDLILADKNFQLNVSRISRSLISFNLMNILRGLLGLLFLVAVCFALSVNRKAINWRLVISGIFIQIVFAILVFKVPFIKSGFEILAGFFVVVLDFTREGSNFLFGGLLETRNVGFLFAFQVLPTIIFFSALTSLLYYLGILQRVVYGIAWLMSKTMRLSGAESLSAAANIFLGQTEAPLMVKPYLSSMTRSEILCIMIGGMATIAGGVLAAYVGFLGGPDPEQQRIFATHLLTASILSAPAAIVASKMLIPETEEVNTDLTLGKEKLGSNFLEAIANGTTDGVKLAINVGAMLLVFTALIAMVNYGIKNGIGEWTGWNDAIRANTHGKIDGLSFQLLLGYLFSPLALIIGVPMDDMLLAGQLLGEKTVLNEFFAYASLANLKETHGFLHAESIIILTYALCGFSNFASIGIQIGGIGTMAPNQKTVLSQLGFKALIGGTVACFMTAAIAGMFF